MVEDKDILGDIDDRKLMAALAYVGVLVLVPILLKKGDPYVNWHIRQGLVILAGIIVAMLATAWIQSVGTLLFIIVALLDVIALVQALLGKRWKVPVAGQLAEKFKI